MQKWCPDAFETTDGVLGGGVKDESTFQSTAQNSASVEDSLAGRFRSESGFSDAQSLLSHLTRKERAQLFDLVEQDVSTEYEEREIALKKEHEEKLLLAEGRMKASMEQVASQLQEALGNRVQELAESSARLAVQLAEKIIRKTAEVDQEILARALQTAQFKMVDNSSLQVCVHPEDESWLTENKELCESLGVTDIQRDRRIERGGCIIRNKKQEWDATLSRQMETLTEIVEEFIATSGHRPDPLVPVEQPEEHPEEQDEPDLD